MDFVIRNSPWSVQERRFNRILVQLLPDLYRVAMALSGHNEDAEDLVHDTCVRAIGAFKDADLPDKAACRAWLRRILVNLHRDRYRREVRSPVCHRRTGDDDNVIEFAQSDDPTPEDWAVYSDLKIATRRAMRALPPEVRVVVALYMVDGRKYKEIAQIVDCPIGTVMSRLARGRRLLRASLQRHVSSQSESTTDANPASSIKESASNWCRTIGI